MKDPNRHNSFKQMTDEAFVKALEMEASLPPEHYSPYRYSKDGPVVWHDGRMYKKTTKPITTAKYAMVLVEVSDVDLLEPGAYYQSIDDLPE